MPEEKKKKFKRRERFLMMQYDNLDKVEVIETLGQIRVRLMRLFANHIGKDNAVTPIEVFKEVVGISPYNLDIFKRNYWWMVIKSVLRQLRSEKELFVVNKGTYLFVLCNEQEKQEVKDKLDRNIAHLKHIKELADDWILNERWKKLYATKK